jgi:hypothetical protein
MLSFYPRWRSARVNPASTAAKSRLVLPRSAELLFIAARLISKPPQWILRITSNKVARLLAIASYQRLLRTLFKVTGDTDELID